MRITDKQRREVAQELRKLTAPGCIRYSEEFYEELREIVASDLDGSFEGVANSLADLIEPEERTCKIKRELHKGYPTTYGICSRCNALVNAESAVSNATDYLPTRYCPSCGARVVSDSD